MAATDYNRKKQLEVTSDNDSGATVDKAQPIQLIGELAPKEFDGFEDGDYTSDPTWIEEDTTGSANVQQSTVKNGEYSLELTDKYYLNVDRGSNDEISNDDIYSAWVKPESTSDCLIGLNNEANAQVGDDAVFIDFTEDNNEITIESQNSSGSSNVDSATLSESYDSGMWYRVEKQFDVSNSEVTGRVYDESGSLVGEKTISYSGASNLQYRYIFQFGGTAFYDDVSYSTTGSTGDEEDTGTGSIILDWSNISGESDIAVYDQDNNLLPYEIESFDPDSETAVLWVYNSWVRDDTVQAQIMYGDGPTSSEEDVTGTWDNSGQNAVMVQHLQDDPLTATDSTSNNNDGTVTSANATTGMFDGAASFDGTDDYIQISDDTTLRPANLTYIGYVNADDFSTASLTVYGKDNGRWTESFEGGDMSAWSGDTSGASVETDATFAPDGDNYLEYTISSGNNVDMTRNVPSVNNPETITMHTFSDSHGIYDDFATYYRDENDNTFLQVHHYENYGFEINNNIYIDGSEYEDLQGQWIKVKAIDIDWDSKTIGRLEIDNNEVDTNIDFLSSDADEVDNIRARIWGTDTYDNGLDGIRLESAESGNKINIQGDPLGANTLRLTVSDSSTTIDVDSAQELQIDTDYMVAGTYDGSTAKVFVDGEEDGSDSTLSGDAQYTSANPRIGARDEDDSSADNHLFEGTIDAFRIYSGAKSNQWIQADYDASPKAGQVFFSQQAAEDTNQPTTLSGSASSTATATGTLQTNRLLSGTVTATSTDTGVLTTVDNRVLSSTTTSTATANGTLTTVDNRVLSGTATGAADLTGSLINANFLSGSFTSNASATGNLTTFDERILSSNLGGASTATGNITTLTEANFSGTATGQAKASGLLTLAEPGVLFGSATTTATATGNLTAFDERILSSTATSTADLTGSLINANFLSGSLISESTAAGNLTTLDERMLSGSLSAQSTAAGSLQDLVSVTLSGDAQGNATISGTLSDELTLSGTAGMEGDVSGVIVAQSSLQGLAEAEAEAQGDITLFVPEEKRYREFTPQKMATVGRQNALAFLNRIDDPSDRYNGDYIYRSMPRTKSQEFDGYPFIVLEGYTFNDIGDTKNGLLSQFDFDIEFHVYGLENSDDDIEAIDAILDQVNYMVKGRPQLKLARGAELTRTQFIRQNRFTGIRQKDQPIVRYEVEVRGKLHLDMEALE